MADPLSYAQHAYEVSEMCDDECHPPGERRHCAICGENIEHTTEPKRRREYDKVRS